MKHSASFDAHPVSHSGPTRRGLSGAAAIVAPIMTLLAVLFLSTSPVEGQVQEQWSSAGPAGHAPIGVMGDHTHYSGEWMVSYMFSRMSMSGLRNGSNLVSVDEAWETFDMVPLEMTMDMHMPHLMYAPSDRVTLMVMAMYMDHQMDVRMANDLMAGHGGHGGHGGHMAERPAGVLPMNHGDHGGHGHGFHNHRHGLSGWADTEVSALVTVFDRNRQRVHLHAGVGIPTGSIDTEDSRMVPEHARLGYPMQLGSGSWEARPGVTWLAQSDRISWGAQGMGIVRLNENSEGWRRGHEALLNGWALMRGSSWAAPGLRVEARQAGEVQGSDPRLDPTISPENDPAMQGGTTVNGYVALNLQMPRGRPLAGHRLALEWGGPMHQSLNGPQMGGDWTVNVGWEYSF